MTIKENIPLAKHFIKKGKEIRSEDLCYLDSFSGEIKSIDVISSSIASSAAISAFLIGGFDVKPDINSEASKIIGKCTTEDIVKYQPIDINKLESVTEKKRREVKKSMNQKLQQNLAGKDFKESISNEVEDSLKNEFKNNIWL